MLLRCDSVYNRLNTDRLMTSRHKQLIVELKFNGQFFFFMKSLVQWIWIFDYSITKKRDFQKKRLKVLYWNMINNYFYNFWYSWLKSQSTNFLNKKTYVNNLIFMISNCYPNNKWQFKKKYHRKNKYKKKMNNNVLFFFHWIILVFTVPFS